MPPREVSGQHGNRGIAYAITGIVVAIAVAGLVVFALTDKPGGTASGTGAGAPFPGFTAPHPPSSPPPGPPTTSDSKLPQAATDQFIQTGQAMERALTSKNVDQLMSYVCEDGRTHGAQNDLLTAAPFLDPANKDHGVPINFLMIGIKNSPQDSPNGAPAARIQISGEYGDGRSTTLEFLMETDRTTRQAGWCGIARIE